MGIIKSETLLLKKWKNTAWTEDDFKALRTALYSFQDNPYKAFQSRLIPDISSVMIGVRLPVLQLIAASIAQNPQVGSYLSHTPDDIFEEIMLFGLVIGKSHQLSDSEWLQAVEEFLPYIKNWSVCDSFCSSLKRTDSCRKEMQKILQRSYLSGKTYHVRFCLVMHLMYFMESEWLEHIFRLAADIQTEDYYVVMAAAWMLSISYIRFPSETQEFLCRRKLSAGLLQKTVQKIRESHQVNAAAKIELLKSLDECNLSSY